MKNIHLHCIKEFVKLHLRHITQIIKKKFNTEKNKNDTKLSTEYWKLAHEKFHPRVFWSIKGRYI